MTDLPTLQRAFGRYLLMGDAAVEAYVVATPRLDAADRLSIYANAYRVRLRDAIATDYPVLRAVVGADAFAALCDAYIAAHPSTSFTLRGFGRHLAEFLADAPGVDERASAIELAQFEWAFVDAFDAPDAEALDANRMIGVEAADWPALTFDVHPSVQLVDTRFNTLRVWDAVKAGNAPPPRAALPAHGGALVWRRRLTTVFRSVQADELALWRLLAQHADFATLCAALTDWLDPDEVPVRAATLLRNWLSDGLISALRAP